MARSPFSTFFNSTRAIENTKGLFLSSATYFAPVQSAGITQTRLLPNENTLAQAAKLISPQPISSQSMLHQLPRGKNI